MLSEFTERGITAMLHRKNCWLKNRKKRRRRLDWERAIIKTLRQLSPSQTNQMAKLTTKTTTKVHNWPDSASAHKRQNATSSSMTRCLAQMCRCLMFSWANHGSWKCRCWMRGLLWCSANGLASTFCVVPTQNTQRSRARKSETRGKLPWISIMYRGKRYVRCMDWIAPLRMNAEGQPVERLDVWLLKAVTRSDVVVYHFDCTWRSISWDLGDERGNGSQYSWGDGLARRILRLEEHAKHGIGYATEGRGHNGPDQLNGGQWLFSEKHAQGAENQRGWHGTPDKATTTTFPREVGGDNQLCSWKGPALKKRVWCWHFSKKLLWNGIAGETDLWREMNFVTSAELYTDRPPLRVYLCLVPTPLPELT